MNGRNNVCWDDRLEMDAWYVEHLSFLLDMKIVLMTVKNVICRKDVTVVVKGQFLDVERRNKQQGK